MKSLQRRIPESQQHPDASAEFVQHSGLFRRTHFRPRTRLVAFGERDNEDLMQERVFRGRWCDRLAPIFGSPVKTVRFCGPLISGARRMMMATRSDTWKIHATFCLSICTCRVSNIWRRRHQPSRLVCRMAAPLLKRLRLHVSRTSIARSASFACSWLIRGRLRSPAPCTPPQPCSPSDRR
jgi:hypothetical protein